MASRFEIRPKKAVKSLRLSGVLLGGIIFLTAGLLHAQLIDVDFNNDSGGVAHGGPSVGPNMSGMAVIGTTGDRWNGITTTNGSGIPLIYANGNTSAVSMSFTSGGGYDANSFGGSTPFAGTSYNNLMEDYLYNGGTPKTITLSGLAKNAAYNLVLYNAGDAAAAGRTTFFTVNGSTQSSIWDGVRSVLSAGVDYVRFTSALSDGSGNLVITYTGNGSAEGDVNGFQIISPSAPMVGIDSLTNGAVFAIPANVYIDASAYVISGAVTNVQFFTNGVSLASVQAFPYYLYATNLVPGAYAITAVGTAAGISTTSSVVNITLIALPTVNITNPTNYAVFASPATVNLAANASVMVGTVTNVQFFANGTLRGADTTAPFNLTAGNLTVGAYALTAVATAAGISATSSVVNVSVVGQLNNPAAYTWTTFAGASSIGSADGVGGNAQFLFPAGNALDTNGNLYVADSYNDIIRKITPAGLVSTVAGLGGTSGFADGMNSAARFFHPSHVALDSAGNLFVADSYNNTIRKITPVGTNWVVSTIAGAGPAFDQFGDPAGGGYADGMGTNAHFGGVIADIGALMVDNGGTVYVADAGNDVIRKIAPVGTNWMVSTIAGSPGRFGTNNGTGSGAQFGNPNGLTMDGAGNLYVADSGNDSIRKITPVGTNWAVATIAGGGFGTNDGAGGAARFFYPSDVTIDTNGNLYVSDEDNDTIRKVTSAGLVSTIAGLPRVSGSTDGTGSTAQFNLPTGIAVDKAGNLYVSDLLNNTIRKITSAGVVRTFAGSVVSPGNVDGTGRAARFNSPSGIAMDGAGNIYVADTVNDTIRQITSAGLVSTAAGLGGSSGSADGAGSNARFNNPYDVAVDSGANLYVTDYSNNTVRLITPAGVVTTLAGLAGTQGTNDGTGSAARFNGPTGIAIGINGNLYVTDANNNMIRKITPAGVVTTIAGLQDHPFGDTDGTNTVARFVQPNGIAADASGNLYVADSGDEIRKLTPAGTNWVTSTIAGPGGYQGVADGVGSNAGFGNPFGIAVDGAGNLYVTDYNGPTVRKITLIGTNWVVTTIGGMAGTFGSSDGAGSAALFSLPRSVVVDINGNVYVADENGTIRKGVFSAYGSVNFAPYAKPPMNGQLIVALLPPEAGGQWRFPWEVAWRTNGQAAGNLVAGNYPVEFRSVPGWLAIPSSLTVGVTNNVILTNQYYPTISTVDTNSGGTLMVTLGPSPPSGAGWRFLGDNTTPFYSSGYSTNLIAGTYLIQFAAVGGRVTPPNLSVQVQTGLTTLLAENYLLASSAPSQVLLPVPVPPANISDLTDYPFGFNGQLQSDVGYGSGVAVQTNVVLTAAHMVFNDQTLSYVSQAYWYFQREAGVFEPEPLAARGWYVLSGYAAQRTNDLAEFAPGTSTPQSRNYDVAALYFLSPVAGGGYGGYLPSDESLNPWLTGNSLKMLVGYPVDGSQFGDASIASNAGEMYQTQPQPFPLSLSTDSVTNQQEVYIAPWFLSYPGNSGGPVYAQFNGYYYPAGVYLGTLYSGVTPYASAVRAIDSDVVNLITNAAALGDNGTNHTGGGVITIIPNQALSTFNPGYLQFQLSPASAVAAGAGWRLQGDSSYLSAPNSIRAVTSANAAVEFKPINGWNLPTNQAVAVQPGQITSTNAFYSVINPVLVAGGAVGIGITGTTGTVYRIERRSSLTSGTWLPVSTNTIASGGFNLLLPNPATNGPVNFYRAVWLQ